MGPENEILGMRMFNKGNCFSSENAEKAMPGLKSKGITSTIRAKGKRWIWEKQKYYWQTLYLEGEEGKERLPRSESNRGNRALQRSGDSVGVVSIVAILVA